MSEILKSRARTYDLLRRLFLWQIDEPMFGEMLGFAKPKSVNFPENAISACLAQNLDENELYTTLQVEYTRLFIGPRHRPAPPFSSVYLSANRLLMQDSTDEASKLYAKFGFENSSTEPDDHVGVELEFLYALANEAFKFYANDEVKFKRAVVGSFEFLNSHFTGWFFKFCDDIFSASNNPFWRETAKFSKEFIIKDLQNLKDMIDKF